MKRNIYIQLFLRSMALSAFTVGGGFVIISVMRRIYVVKLRWLTEEDMLDITSLAQSCPGAAAVNAAILAGHRIGGIGGAALSVIGTILPPIFIMSVFAALYSGLNGMETVQKLMTGMQAGVAAILLDTALVLTKNTLSGGTLRTVLFALALLLSVFTKTGTALIILGAGIIGILIHLIRVMRREA